MLCLIALCSFCRIKEMLAMSVVPNVTVVSCVCQHSALPLASQFLFFSLKQPFKDEGKNAAISEPRMASSGQAQRMQPLMPLSMHRARLRAHQLQTHELLPAGAAARCGQGAHWRHSVRLRHAHGPRLPDGANLTRLGKRLRAAMPQHQKASTTCC